jgi:hypothetical protein
VRLARACAADQHQIALTGQEATAGEVAHQGFVDRRAGEDELVDLLGEWQLGDGQLVLHRARLLLVDLGGEQIADDPLRLVLALHGGGDDLVVGGLHAEQLEPAHGVEDLGTLHQTAPLRLS